MNLKPLFNVLGALLTLLGVTMVIPIFISYFTGGYDLFGFIYYYTVNASHLHCKYTKDILLLQTI